MFVEDIVIVQTCKQGRQDEKENNGKNHLEVDRIYSYQLGTLV